MALGHVTWLCSRPMARMSTTCADNPWRGGRVAYGWQKHRCKLQWLRP
jgi:hypothetical protein